MVYLAGLGRSGSTLLERLLGEMPGACPAGEVVHLWLRGVRDGERCGCGQPFLACPFWEAVGQEAFGGWAQVDVDRITRLRAQVDRSRFLPQLASPALRRRLQPALDEYVGYYQHLYAAIGQVSGDPVVIDSSKHASLAFCLRSSPGLDLRVVHMVRDSRAVAYSWSKVVDRPEADAGSQMATYTPASAAMRWNLQNSALQLLTQLGTPTLRVRYEDFTADPAGTLGRIAAFAGLPGPLPGCPPLTAGVLGTDKACRLVGRAEGHPHRVRKPHAVHDGPGPGPPGRHVAGRDAGQQTAHGDGPDPSAADALRLPGRCGMSGVS